jgi:hypothetical protein
LCFKHFVVFCRLSNSVVIQCCLCFIVPCGALIFIHKCLRDSGENARVVSAPLQAYVYLYRGLEAMGVQASLALVGKASAPAHAPYLHPCRQSLHSSYHSLYGNFPRSHALRGTQSRRATPRVICNIQELLSVQKLKTLSVPHRVYFAERNWSSNQVLNSIHARF